MFSKQIQTIFRVLGNALLTLAAMPADEHEEMTASDYIAKLDTPDTGREVPTGAAAVFGALPDINKSPALLHAAAVFDTPTAPAAATVFGAVADPELPTYTMTDKAQGFTREQYHAANWTDDTLIEDGYMVASGPKPAPVIAAAPAPAIAPVVTPGTSTQAAAPQAAPSGAPPPPAAASQSAPAPAVAAQTAVQVPAAHAMRDSNGLPWDARIHSGARTINADGGWKKKKGVSDVELARVTAELRSAGPAQVAAPFTPLNAAAPAPVLPAPAAPPVAVAAPAPAPAPPAPATGPIDTFPALCRWITANGFTMPQALKVGEPYGVKALGELAMASHAHFIPMIHADLAAQRQAA